MAKKIIAIFLFCLTLVACGQRKDSDNVKGLTIDPKIKTEVEKHINDSKELDVLKDKMQVYENTVIAEFYQNDSLTYSSVDKENKQVFKSFYLWKNDTLAIDGAFGLFGGTGFVVNICKGNATLYHMLSSDDSPSYAYKQNDSLIFRLEIPCTDTKIVLSEIPDSTKKQIIFGYVEFKSGDYYASEGSADGQEILPRQKLRTNMKIYFRSGKLDL